MIPEKGGGILKQIRESEFSFEKLGKSYPELDRLRGVLQNPDYHAEGDVYQHTKLVCQKLMLHPDWQELPDRYQELLFLSAMFHDIGKIACTKFQDGAWTSPKHAIVGEQEFRRLVYREADRFGLLWEEREMVAKLIRYHGLPVWFFSKRRPEYDMIKAAESIPMSLLYLLSRADAKGRRGTSRENLIEHVELFADYAKELGIWEGPYNFSSPYTKFEYFRRLDLWQGADLFDKTSFEVLLMSGLPLSGKDTWIAEHGEGRIVISLDDIREEFGISPSKKSDKVVQIAMERARKLLRKKEPFIWNGTNLIQETRQRLMKVFSDYGARVHIVYVEAPYKELYKRNQKRERYIPENVLERMIDKLEIPAPWEAYKVRVVQGGISSKETSENYIEEISNI